MREFLAEAFGHVGLDWQEYVRTDPRDFPPTEADYLMADARKAQTDLGWAPRIGFHDLVHLMVEADRRPRGSSRRATRAASWPKRA